MPARIEENGLFSVGKAVGTAVNALFFWFDPLHIFDL